MRKMLVFLFLFLLNYSFGQDIHFSQNFIDRMYLNPSLIGDVQEDIHRISIQRKSQWNSISVPFSTFATSYEHKNIIKGINLGAQFLNDKSGDSELTLNQMNIALSKTFNISKVNRFSVGTILGIAQKNLDFSELIFEEEEDILNTTFIYPDIGIGINYKTNPYQILSYSVGMSSFHINKPNHSFNEDDNIKLKLKNNYHIGVKYIYQTQIVLYSDVIFTNQESSKELLIGSRVELELNEVKLIPLVYYRLEDAIIFGIGLEKNNIQANMSYDVNTSDLNIASNNKGGFEFSLIYKWKKRKKNKIKTIEEKCPKYL